MATKKAAKKKTTKKKATRKPAKKTRRARKPKEMRLTGELYWKYRAAMFQLMAKREAGEKTAQALEHERQKPQYAPLIQLEASTLHATRDVVDARAEYTAIQREVAGEFSISLAALQSHEFTINEDTGIIDFHPPAKGEKG